MKCHAVNPIIRQCKLSDALSGIANAAQQEFRDRSARVSQIKTK